MAKEQRHKRYGISTILFFIAVIVYIMISVISYKTSYYEIKYNTSATVIDKYYKVDYSRVLDPNKNYLQIRYGDNYSGLVLVSKYLYNMIEIGDTIYIKVYEKYRRLDDINVECIVLFDHL